MKRLLVISVFVLLFVGLSSKVQALNAQLQRVTVPGGRMLQLVESKPKQQDNLNLQFGFNYALKPYEFGQTSTGNRVQGIVDHMATFDFGLGYSVTDRFALGLNVPFHITNNIQSLTNFNEETAVSFGDISLAALYTILDRQNSSAGFGLGVIPFLTFPSGQASNFVGDSSFTGGAMLTADVEINDHYIVGNWGFRFREEENFLNLKVGQEMLYRFGYHHFLSRSLELDGFIETGGSIVLNGVEGNSSPFEIMAGLSKTISFETPLTVKLANGVGFGSGYGTPDYRVSLQVGYDIILPRLVKGKRKQTKLIQTIEKRLRELTIYYPTDGSRVDPFYEEKISEIASILKEHPDLGPLYVVSHSDDVGEEAYNDKLSKRRSEKAYQSLVKYGVSHDRVMWFGVGEGYPLYPNDSNVNRALNRRTVFTFTRPVYIDEAGAQPAEKVIQSEPGNDSYTEVLKEKARTNTLKEGEYYKEDTVLEEKEVVEEVEEVKKERPKRVRTKRKKAKKASTKDATKEQDLSSGDDFDESF